MIKNTIRQDEFLTFTKSTWDFSTESTMGVGHPAPFPIELPYRCIQLYTFEDEVILDPFCEAGSTCIAAMRSERRFVGYDINKEYVKIAIRRITDMLVI